MSLPPYIELQDLYAHGYTEITNAHKLLFDLLTERTPEQSISHKAMPTWEQHVDFVDSHPYKAWYLISKTWPKHWDTPGPNREFMGTIYLTHAREVGIQIKQEHRGTGIGTTALAKLRERHPGPLLANVNPKNERSIAFFKKHGATLLQHTYAL